MVYNMGKHPLTSHNMELILLTTPRVADGGGYMADSVETGILFSVTGLRHAEAGQYNRAL